MVSQAHLMNNRVGEVVDEVDGLGHVHRRLQLVLLRQLQQLPGERKDGEVKTSWQDLI